MSEKITVKTKYLPRYETFIYFVLWIGAVLYSIYRVYLKTQRLLLYPDEDLQPGWKWLGRKQDRADSEWNRLILLGPKIMPYIIVQLVLCEAMAAIGKKHITTSIYISTSFLFCVSFFGLVPTLVMIAQVLIFYVATRLNSASVIWLIVIINLYVLNTGLLPQIPLEDHNTTSLWLVTVAWNILRCTSYALDAVSCSKSMDRENEEEYVKNLIKFNEKYAIDKMVAHCFFLPHLTCGPVLLYGDFEPALHNGFRRDNVREKYWNLFLYVTRFLFWTIFTDFMLHFIYLNLLEYYTFYVKTFSPWELYGYGYLLGQFFCMKYVTSYGLASAFSRAHGIDAPGHPKCIGRIHLYSDMWRYFDQGLYKYLVQYIYAPMMQVRLLPNKLTTKLLSSLICFTFIYLWHGTRKFILIWTVLNFIGVTVEGLCKEISKSNHYKNLVTKYLSDDMQLRLNAVLSAPLLAMSAISNFYFFAGLNIGYVFVDRFVFGEIKYNLILLFFLFCCCNVSHCIRNWEMEKSCKNANKTDIKDKIS